MRVIRYLVYVRLFVYDYSRTTGYEAAYEQYQCNSFSATLLTLGAHAQ